MIRGMRDMFYIRADGNEQIGMGHIMRCLTIAKALKSRGCEVEFLIADDKPVKVLEEHGMAYHILFTYYDEMDVELPQLVLYLMGGSTKPTILIDSYYVTKFYVQNLKPLANVVLMDDNLTDVYPCDALVNYNIYGKTLGYEEKYPESTLFLGMEYMPLRKEFIDVEYNVKDDVQNILLTTGGGDSCHMALKFMKRLAKMQTEKTECILPTMNWHVVCGPYNTDVKELEQMAKECSFIKVHKNVNDMSILMKACDIAISAAGSTLYELCAVGVPSIGFYFADNQRQNMEAFGKMTPIMNAGDFSIHEEAVFEFIEKGLLLLIESKQLREKISMAMRTLVDGKGAERLAKALERDGHGERKEAT